MLVKGNITQDESLSADDLAQLSTQDLQVQSILLLQDIRGILINMRENQEKALNGDGFAAESTLDASDYETPYIEP